MEQTFSHILNVLFSLALFVNAALFIPQALKIYTTRSMQGVSLLTFVGFLVIQFITILHAWMVKDYILLIGFFLSMLTCGAVIFLVLRYRGNSVDVTDAKQKDLERLTMLEDIIGLLPEHVYWKDRNGIILGGNDQQALDAGLKSRYELVGKGEYDLIKKDLSDEIKKQQATAIRKVDQEIMETGVARILEEPAIYLDGKEAIYLSNKVPLFNKDKKVIGMVGISFDITKQKQLEEELKNSKKESDIANHIKTEFIKTMQHDIQTPAAGLYHALTQLKQKEENEETKHYLEMLSQMSRQLLNLCREFVESTDAEIGEHPLIIKNIDIRQLARDALGMNQYAAFNKELTLQFKITEQVPEMIETDGFRLQRILMNLLNNAVKFTDKGSVSLEIDMAKEQHHVTVQISVKDTGIGIEKDKQQIIFSKYSRAVNEDSGYPGFGLGLYIVKKFVDDLHGEIQVESELSQGTTFLIKLLNDTLESTTGREIDEVLTSPW
jgi:two-component system aerobic respiration control sensor histidine kinase ArcB